MHDPSLTRRAALAAAVGTLVSRAVAADPPRVPVVDTHLHCFAGKDDAKFPYHKNAPYTPDAATPEHLLKCMAGSGTDFAIVVHPEPYQDDHRYLEQCLAVGKGKLKGTCLVFADRDDAPKQLADLAKKLPLVAARVHAYNPDRLPPFGKPELRALWKAAGDAGLALQLHFEPRWAEGFEPLIREFKDVRVFVDHLGRPFQGTEKEHARVVGWSKFDHVAMKLSAVPDRKTYPHRDPQPVVKQLTEAFGMDRLMFGGGFAAGSTPASYKAERDRVAALLAHLSDADRAKVFGGTAAKLMGFKLGMNYDDAIEPTRRWIAEFVIGLNLCPFARRVFEADLIRYVVTPAADEETLIAALTEELKLLARSPRSEIETTILIHPSVLADFFAYNDFLAEANRLLKRLGLTGVIQIASFHPQHQFEGTDTDAPENGTNRSPFPMLHLLREASITEVASHPETLLGIPERNIETMRRRARNERPS